MGVTTKLTNHKASLSCLVATFINDLVYLGLYSSNRCLLLPVTVIKIQVVNQMDSFSSHLLFLKSIELALNLKLVRWEIHQPSSVRQSNKLYRNLIPQNFQFSQNIEINRIDL